MGCQWMVQWFVTAGPFGWGSHHPDPYGDENEACLLTTYIRGPVVGAHAPSKKSHVGRQVEGGANVKNIPRCAEGMDDFT